LQPIGDARSATTTIRAPGGLSATDGSFVEVDISAESVSHRSWQQPVRAFFRRGATGWTLVGLERLSDRP
jgi:hypothetical protein